MKLLILLMLAAAAACSKSQPPTTPTPTVVSIAISGNTGAGVVGQTMALTATATYSDGATANVTNQAAWDSSDTAVATVSATGILTFRASGTVDVRATFQNVAATTRVTVAPPAPTLSSIAVTGVAAAVAVGDTATLVATATYSDNSTAIVSGQVAWTSSNTGVATISGAGVVNFVGAGEVDLRAALSGITGQARVAVTANPVFRNLDGTVRDNVSNAPIEGVRVNVRGGPNDGRSTTTDAGGGYLFTGLQTSSFTLEFSTDKPYSPATRDVNFSDDTRIDVTLTPNVGQFYGQFTIALTVLQDTCQPPPNLSGFGTGTLVLTGQPNGTGVSARITERGVARTYTGGRMNIDGTFDGGLPAGTLFPGAVRLLALRPLHEVAATMQGKVSGNGITGTEFITYTVGCQPGATITIAISGSK